MKCTVEWTHREEVVIHHLTGFHLWSSPVPGTGTSISDQETMHERQLDKSLFLFLPHTHTELVLIPGLIKVLLNLGAEVETGTMLDVSPALFIWTRSYCMCVHVLSCTRTQQLLHHSALINSSIFDLLMFTLFNSLWFLSSKPRLTASSS